MLRRNRSSCDSLLLLWSFGMQRRHIVYHAQAAREATSLRHPLHCRSGNNGTSCSDHRLLQVGNSLCLPHHSQCKKKTQMVRRHARRLAVGSAARSAFTAQVAFAHLIVGFDASHPLQCSRAACRLAERTVLTSQRGSSTGSTMGLASIGPHASSSVLFRTQCTLTESGVATSFGAHLHNAIAACYISKYKIK